MIELVATFIFFLYLFALAAFDWKKKLLPLEPMMLATLVAFLYRLYLGAAISSVLGLLLGVCFIGVQYLISNGRWMGRGDIWFVASIGAFLTIHDTFVALYLTYTVGGLIAFVLYITGVYKRGMRIPFAPFLSLGAVGAAIWGWQIYGWFVQGFGLV